MCAFDESVCKKSLMFTKVRYANKNLFAFDMWDSCNSIYVREFNYFINSKFHQFYKVNGA